MHHELGFLGAGNMAQAIATAAIDKSVLRPEQMIASDPSDRRRSVFSRLGVATSPDNATVIRQSKQILVAVKPQTMALVAADIGRYGSADQVVLSIMAGVSTRTLSQAIAAQHVVQRPRVIRIMPNTPVQVGCGMAGVALGQHAHSTDHELAMRLFAAAGKVVLVEESKLDAITAVSGSGPAYVFYLAEAMQQAACELGLAEHAQTLVEQTILGAARLLEASGQGPASLRRNVTSPGGTTEAAIKHLEDRHAGEVIVGAVQAAARRSEELDH